MADVKSKKPSECSVDELTSFESLVNKGGEVVGIGLSDRIRNAERLVFLVEDNGVLSGIAALKKPLTSYKKKVFNNAESKENPDEFTLEVGWIYVEEEFRGRKYSQLLLGEVLRLAGEKRVYATTRENNEAMSRTNLRFGLEQSGHPYKSNDDNYNLVLYIKR